MIGVHAEEKRGAVRQAGHRSLALHPLLWLLLGGLALRLVLAFVVFPNSGFENDIATYAFWSQRLHDLGPGRFYDPGVFADYPPGYLSLLWVGGEIVFFLNGGNAPAVDLLKLGPIVADVLIAFVLYRLVRSWADARAGRDTLALVAAALYLFNPVTWYDSAIWGQTDAVGALVVLLGIGALVRGNSEGATALAALAALVKPQFGVLLIPVVAAVLLHRHLIAPGSGPRHRPWAPRTLRGWLERVQGPVRLVTSALVGLAVVLVIITPFRMSVPDFVVFVAGAAGGYPWLTVNAFNPWALFGAGGTEPLFKSGFVWSSDTVPLLGPLPGVVIGTMLLVLGFLAGVLRAAWRSDRRSVVIVAVFLGLAFFILPTRVHERYVFPVFALLPLLAVVDRRWLMALAVLSVATFINLHGVLTLPLYATPNLENLLFGELFRTPLFIVISLVLATGAFCFVAWQLRPSGAAVRDPWAVPEPAAEPAEPAQSVAPAEPAEPAELPVDAGFPADVDDAETALRPGLPALPALAARSGWTRGAMTRFLYPSPLRRDRSPRLIGEGGGRLDRIDLLLVLVVFVVALGLRTYRLEEPYTMHFDEVYHARTAMEFLQDWRYDIPHSIYEYTHPHMAKYLMAAGLELLGNNRVTGEWDLDADVRAAAGERRWSPSDDQSRRNGDWLYVATPTELRAYDLPSHKLAVGIPGVFTAVAVDPESHKLFVADSAGAIWRLPTEAIDVYRHDPGAAVQPALESFARPAGLTNQLTRLFFARGQLIAGADDGSLISFDGQTGIETGRSGRTATTGPTSVVGVDGGTRVLADPQAVDDVEATAARLAELLDDDAARIRALLGSPRPGPAVVAGFVDGDMSDEVQAAIDDGGLPGVSIEDGDALAVNRGSSIVLLDSETLDELESFPTDAPVGGMALVEEGVDKPTIYAAMGNQLQLLRLPADEKPQLGDRLPMPNEVTDVFWNSATTYVHVMGRSQDTEATTIYVLDPGLNSVFADAVLPFEPGAVVQDIQPERPAEDREHILAIGPDGRTAMVDAGDNAFAYRFPGVLAGALMAACIYLLGRFLFRRRNVAVIAALLVLADGMFFSNARIAMNDTYVALFIVAALTVFVPLWLGRWRSAPRVAIGIVAVAVLLGLALASKWVALYAIGALILLTLVRSALGRLIALVAMIGMTGVLGYIAIVPATNAENPQINYPFLGLMVVLTIALAVGSAVRPVRWTRDELRLITFGPGVLGILLVAAGGLMFALGWPDVLGVAQVSAGRVMLAGAAMLALGAAAYLAARFVGRLGFGPLAPPLTPPPGVERQAPPVDRGWLRPGSGPLGVSWLLGLAALTLIPVAVYVVSYIPWIDLGNRWTDNLPAGNTGQTFLDLQRAMYDYHNFLRVPHAASSPWWAWPFDLKPVWFEQSSYANGVTGVIYNTGNLVIFWLAIPAVIWVGYQAWQRRSLSLGFVLIAILCLWLPWARIDRVSFQYHVFTSLPFSFLSLAYFLAELWNGPSRRTWLLARSAAALAIIGPPLLWLLRLPLCAVARTEQVNKGAEVCGTVSRQLVLTDLMAVGVLLAIGGLALAAVLFYLGVRSPESLTGKRLLLLPATFSIALAGMMTAIIGAGIPGPAVFEIPVRIEEPALLALMLMLVPAYICFRSRDARRFVVGVLVAAVAWFVVFYPNFSGLPVPLPLSQIHLGLLPTWNWSFQFGANLDAANRQGIDPLGVVALSAVVFMLSVSAVVAARAWRAERAYRRMPLEPVEAA